ncbi:hypothetical protein DCAR_0414818 [Daucus carota subsp. sativus]|uniref:Response regulatory domain-containing protein n=1 Tax=Daucus carota subsp. sativus TaxID=79200 RepID=A0AAF0WV88_DAUCS|nr:hypothetical protein DCAR_0414818 [Daucus carota subsp. sativus]
MYSVLAVDDDRTCLFIMKACLKKWNYQVTIVKNANEALSMLGNKSFDLVLTDVHMPDMNGFELQRCIIQEFSLPVILISADTRAEVMCNGLKNGAQRFLVKPVMADDLKDIWQFAKWWKRTKNIISAPPSQISGSSQESVTMVDSHNGNYNISLYVFFSLASESTHLDNTTGKNLQVRVVIYLLVFNTGKNTRLVWTWDLHSRFVEAILLIGYHRAVPTNILEVMNVEGLTRRHVASHLQNLSYTTNQMDYSDQNTLADENDNNTGNSGAHGGANNIMFSSTNNVTPSSFSHFWENFQSKQSINVGDKNSNYIFYGNNINTDQLTQV